jgi:hypothetical protein
MLLVVVCLLGLAASALWLYSISKRGPAGGPPAILLSDSTKTVLSRLDSPLEIRFYALLDPATVPDSLTAFASRAGQLLSAYQQEAGSKIKLTIITSLTNPNVNAAEADDLSAFNRDKGEVCYLGVALALNGRKETLPRLSPEWEQALEPDLSRAILRLVDATRVVVAARPVSQTDTNVLQEVKALIPDVAAVSVEDGKQIIRDAALKDYTAAAKEIEAQIKEAEQRLLQVQNGGSEAEQQAAMKHLQQVRAEQNEKLKQLAARAKVQIDTFQQLKAAAR